MNQATATGGLEVLNLSKAFDSTPVLRGLTLSVHPGEYFSLLGPSGCGKTTLLRILAGLDQADSGDVQLDSKSISQIPAHLRPVNTVFQNYALFPHLNVRQNIEFGLRMKSLPEPEILSRVDRVLDLARVRPLSARKPSELSGGQRQRVALARAIVNQPRVLLLDEPLGALDLQLRKELQTELRTLQRQLGTTFIHVTHDQDEAMALSDRIAILNHGEIEQIGSPTDLYHSPRSPFVASFLGVCNLFPATIQSLHGSTVRLDSAWGPLTALSASANSSSLPSPGSKVTVGIRPEQVQISPSAPPSNSAAACVTSLSFAGPETHLTLEINGSRLEAWLPSSSPFASNLTPGNPCFVHFPPDRLQLFPEQRPF